ncbi:hypothetical protein L2E82_22098 [Cichorium intybus]|uniref:Uncharacterized protein n=1 Tax=Cichorium intybus TaxID=13427 RepID=A0ACB9DX90_CICIN|nr:hypothetical protein L2E82_22098 [Cichorium intybus]
MLKYFIQEARNSIRTAINFKHSSRIKIPKVFQELTTNEVDDLEFIREMGIDPKKVAKVLVEAFAEMIFLK